MSLLEKARERARALAVACACVLVAGVSLGAIALAGATVEGSAPRGAAAVQHQGPIMVNARPAAAAPSPLLQPAVLRSQDAPSLRGPMAAPRALDCLTAAVYYEARGETSAGQAAVAQVVLNRTHRPEFPKTVCGVVFQGAAAHACQFSFACDATLGAPHESGAWRQAQRVAARALGGYVMTAVGHATHFHVLTLGAVWGVSMIEVAQVGDHGFYVRSSRKAPTSAAVTAPAREAGVDGDAETATPPPSASPATKLAESAPAS